MRPTFDSRHRANVFKDGEFYANVFKDGEVAGALLCAPREHSICGKEGSSLNYSQQPLLSHLLTRLFCVPQMHRPLSKAGTLRSCH